MRPIQKPDYGWEVGLQWARNRGVVLTLNGPQYIFFGSGVAQVVRRWGAAFAGLHPLRPIRSDPAGRRGRHRLRRRSAGRDVHRRHGLPGHDPNQRILANPNPRWTGSVRSAFRYRKLQISGLLDIRHGGVVPNDVKVPCGATGRTSTPAAGVLRRDDVHRQYEGLRKGRWFDGPVVGPGAGSPFRSARTGIGRATRHARSRASRKRVSSRTAT